MNQRSSIIGPLVLILVGTLFLIHNLNRDLSILRTAAQYWPWLLIGWGTIRLAEVLLWHQTGKPLPRRGLSSGEWGLVVMVCLLGVTMGNVWKFRTGLGNVNIRGWGWQLMGEQFDFPVQGESAAANVERVVVENLRGNARIAGADDAKVVVNGRKTIRAMDRATAERANTATGLEITRQGNVLYVRTAQERWSGEERVSADIELTVPKTAIVECRGRFGDFDVSDLRSAVVVNSDNAGVRLQNITGKVDIAVRRSDVVRAVNIQGDVNLRGGGEYLEFDTIAGQVTANFAYTGELKFKNLAKPLRFESNTVTLAMEAVPGRLQLSRGEIDAENVVGPSRIRSSSKDVRVSEFTGPAVVEVERGDIQLAPGKGPLAQIDARTRSGDIEVALPDKAGFSIQAKVDRGSAENEYGNPLQKADEGRTQRITGSTGAGPLVQLAAGKGSIRVRKAGALAARVESQ